MSMSPASPMSPSSPASPPSPEDPHSANSAPSPDGAPEVAAEGADFAIAVQPNNPGLASTIPADNPDYVDEDGPTEDTAGNPLSQERQEALGEHKPFD